MKPSRRRGGSGRQKILIIEDDPVARADLEARLEANGYIVARVADAASAMTVVNRERPDLILLDLGLPAGDGFLVLERLRKITALAAIPVLVITGRSDAETRKRVEGMGVPPVLVKPVQTEALLAAIAEALETKSASTCRTGTPRCRKNALSWPRRSRDVAQPTVITPNRAMSRDPVVFAADEEPRVQAEVRRAALQQLLAGGPLAESVHIVLVTVVAALVWNSLPLAVTIGWVGAVAAAAALRTWWRLGLSQRTASPEEALRGVRLTVAGVGLAWGFGAAAAIPALGLDEAALILVVLAGIVAGGTGTLVGGRGSFLYLLLTVLSPLPVGILLQGHSRQHVLAIVLIAMFAWGMDRVHRRAHRTFAERVRAAALLERSTRELARQHAYLDALIASTPVAIAVLDDQRVVRSVNPAFEALFGYSASEALGEVIDGLRS